MTDPYVLALERQVADLEQLVRWLALPYAGRTPIFGQVDDYGNVLAEGVTNTLTWRRVIGDTDPAAQGAWVKCSTCGQWHVQTITPGEATCGT